MFSKRRIYLDWAASAPVSRKAQRAFTHALPFYGNPSSPHGEGRAAHALLEDARTRIARLAGVKADAVLFTAGATEANALAILGHVRARRDEHPTPHVLYLSSQHASVTGSMEVLRTEGVNVEATTIEDLAKRLTPETVLVSVDVVCGETGARYKVRDIRRTLDAYTKQTGTKITLHADASQAPFVESFELPHLGADLVTLDAQKVGGVRGIGVLIAPRRMLLTPLMVGGGQERGMRPGTESVAHAFALAAALEEAHENRATFLIQAQRMRNTFIEAVTSALPQVVVNEGRDQAPHIMNLSFLGRDTDYMVALLDTAGIAVSTKSACETDERGSRAVLAMTGDDARATTTLRISFGPSTREADLAHAASALISAVRFLDANTI